MERHNKGIIVIFCIVAIIAALVRVALVNSSDKNTTISISSILSEAIDMAELSTAEFKYKGIADIYSDEEKTKIKCRVCYAATVKAGVDVKEIVFDVDNENKIVIASLPKVNYKVTIVDGESMDLLPSDADVDLDSMLKACREDVEREAMESPDLLKTAEDNLKSTIEGLLYRILKTNGYELTWN